MISVVGLAKSFGERTLWSDVNFTVNKGEMLALVGPSGSGKSTLLNCMGVLERASSGEIIVDGTNVTKLRAPAQRRFRRDTLGYLFQNYALIENATVNFNLQVAVGGRRGRTLNRHAIEAALDRVGLGNRGKEMVYRLSGGEQQRVALARLIVKKSTLALADEPTGALDSANAGMVIEVLREQAESGCTVIIATHSKEVEQSCDSALALG
ncbi:ATP-binding cassette domain-containing protein [Micromonospora inaquosa]|uniref:Lipoprotein ABC transporter ATP-binding protein n=1 Tax=Micromonospora inaquosa TaxID=2203716 RepID=A0A3N9WT28_9ACTN|nr:ATP-binding cassette domain-containing protein [Micromonospora inaquosa]RQX03859.1 lipoprotein ABC transporter ATP-binding protein [Micromonospora inaquosa]